jgi:hypothetical protein
MAALTVTATSVLPSTSAQSDGVLGETATAGQAVYLKASDSRLWLCQCDGTAAEAAAVGILLTGGAAGQPAKYATSGVINIGATTAKVHYFANPTAGGVGLQADILSTQYITRLGYSTATDGTFTVDIRATGQVF